MTLDNSIYRVQFKTERHYYDLYVRHVFPNLTDRKSVV